MSLSARPLLQITYGVGTLLRRGVLGRFKDLFAKEGSGMQRAVAAVQKHGRSVGAHAPSS